MAVNSVSNTTSSTGSTNVKEVDKDKIGFNGLTSDTFMKLLITQLQNQDPTEPVGNDELLQQLSAMRNLSANIELSDTLKNLASSQQITAGAGFLGKFVTGLNASKQEISGVADRVFVKDGQTIIGIGEHEIPLSSITSVALVPRSAQAA